MHLMIGVRTDACCLVTYVGMGSRLQVAQSYFLMISRISPDRLVGMPKAEVMSMVLCQTLLHGLLASCSIFFILFTEEVTHPRSYLGIRVTRRKSSDVCPVQKFVHNTEKCFPVTRTLSNFVFIICITCLSDYG